MLKRQIIYLAALISVLVVNILYVEYEPFILLVVLILFPILLRIILQIQKNRLDIYCEAQKKIVNQGETIELNTKAVNQLPLPVSNVIINLQMKYANYEEVYSHPFNFGIGGYSLLNLSTSVTSDYCGKINFFIKEIKIFDFCSLFKIRINCHCQEKVIVMPKLYEQSHNRQRSYNAYFSDSDEYSQEKPGDDPSEVFELRNYADGDNLNKIHWKLSSKGEDLIVKEYSLPMTKTEVILVELWAESSEEGRKNIDCIYQTAYAAGNYLCKNGVPFELAYFDKAVNKLKIITIDNFLDLQTAIMDIMDMVTYERPLAWNYFWSNDISENARLHYIIYRGYGTSDDLNVDTVKSSGHISEDNIIMTDQSNLQEMVDQFYLKI